MKTIGFVLRLVSISICVFALLIANSETQSKTAVYFQCTRSFNIDDYNEFVKYFLKPITPESAPWDLNGDGIIDLSDYSIIVRCFMKPMSTPLPEPGVPPVDDIQLAWRDNPNFPNVESYCQSLGYQGMRIVDAQPKAHGVFCVRNGSELASIDMNNLCQSFYGPQAQAVITNMDSPYGWACNTGQPDSSSAANPVDNASADTQPPAEPDRPPQISGDPVPSDASSIHATANFVNVRSGPGTDYPVIGQVSSDSGYFSVLGTEVGWIHISFPGGDGWISGEFAQQTSNGQISISPIPVVIETPAPLIECPSGTGPNGIQAGGYPPEKLTQEQRQWLFTVFGNPGTAPVGYGGQACASNNYGTGDDNYRAFVCSKGERGPGGILIGGYDPTTLTQDQRQWLFNQFGNQGIAPVGYGGESCPVTVVPQCPGGYGPGGITAGGYTPQDLTQEQRQWLWEQFRHDGTAPVGYGGENCTGRISAPRPCPTGVGEPGSYDPTSLTQQQRNELFWAFGHTGEAPVGYGGETCVGGTMTLTSFTSVSNTSSNQPTGGSSSPTGGVSSSELVVDPGQPLALWPVSAYVTSSTGVNVRSGAGTEHTVIGLAGFHGYFEVIAGPINGWYLIQWGGGLGWISGEFAQIINFPQASLPSTPQENTDLKYAFGSWTAIAGDPHGNDPNDPVTSVMNYSVAVIYAQTSPGQYQIRSASLGMNLTALASFYCQMSGSITIHDDIGRVITQQEMPIVFTGPSLLGRHDPQLLSIEPSVSIGHGGEVEVTVAWQCASALEYLQASQQETFSFEDVAGRDILDGYESNSLKIPPS